MIRNPVEQRKADRKRSAFYWLPILLYKLTLDIILYYQIIIPYAGGNVIFISDFSIGKYVVGSLFSVLIARITIEMYRRKSISSKIIMLLNLLYFMPGCSLYAFAVTNQYYFLFYGAYWLILVFWEYSIPAVNPRCGLMTEKNRDVLFYATLAFSLGAIILVAGYYNSFRINLDLSQVYGLRTEMKTAQIRYMIWQPAVFAASFLPIAIAYFVSKRKWIYVAIAAIMLPFQLMIYSFGANKTMLFLVPVALWVGLMYKGGRKTIVRSLLMLNVAAIAEQFCCRTTFISDYIQRRVFYVPNGISRMYFEFFGSNPFDYYVQGTYMLSRFLGFDSDYAPTIGYCMGEYIRPGQGLNANTGLVGAAFANAGYASLLIDPLIVILALKILDICTRNLAPKYLLIIAIIVAFDLMNGNNWAFSVFVPSATMLLYMAVSFMPREHTPARTP